MTAETHGLRPFDALTRDERARAVAIARAHLLDAICAGGVRFDDEANGDDLQARIDAAAEEMDRLRTPWFLAERLMEDEHVADELTRLALADAEDALYRTPDAPPVVTLAAEVV